MKVCPVCSIDFFPNDPQRVYCSQKCCNKASYARTVRRSQVNTSALMAELSKYGIHSEQIPYAADAEFLSDLLWALKIITKR